MPFAIITKGSAPTGSNPAQSPGLAADAIQGQLYVNTPSGWVNTAVGVVNTITANGAINPHLMATYMITKAGVASMTLAAPTAVVDDGVVIDITSATAFAHVIVATGLLLNGTSATAINQVTFTNAFAGASVTLLAYNGKWNVIAQGPGTYTYA